VSELPERRPTDQGEGRAGGYPIPAPPTYAGPTRERWAWTAVVVAIGLIIGGLMLFGGFGGLRGDLQQVAVADVLTSPGGPAARFGTHEIQIVGWYAQVSTGCRGDAGGADAAVSWLQAECPVRALLAQQPATTPTQAELLRDGLRLAAPNGKPFPPPTPVGSGTAGLEQLVYTGHFDDAAAASCVPDRRDECRNTFVVSDYVGLIK
jgi:hypothetical protein